ncbi:unnamed protein product [Vitrella brassicaformis CCMP3155]|uniref:Uncharacterized protein n=1 Tax=Vitrella brassicaformis (strain CCMP3155) TaxID=1169540 RepID=A0A0G4EK67_VITBC|nr:unnamed protein product [Vitrella brassicaformis CCMP3155]|eukprot:CEL97835.1 unnamed protein product [Vitrella brassicaformis CCMP3155]
MPVLSKSGHLQLYTGRPSYMGSITMGRGPPKAQQTHRTQRSSVPMVVLGATGAQEALHAAQQTVQAMKTASAERLAKRTAVRERTRQSLKDKERAEYTRLIESNPKLLGGLSAGRPSAARKTRQNNKSTGLAANGAVVGTRAAVRELAVDTAVPESSSARVSPSAALPLPPSPQQVADQHTADSSGVHKEDGKAAGGSDGSRGCGGNGGGIIGGVVGGEEGISAGAFVGQPAVVVSPSPPLPKHNDVAGLPTDVHKATAGEQQQEGGVCGGGEGAAGVSSSYVRGDSYELRSEGFSRLRTVRPCRAAAAYMSRANAAIGQWAPRAVKVQRGDMDDT